MRRPRDIVIGSFNMGNCGLIENCAGPPILPRLFNSRPSNCVTVFIYTYSFVILLLKDYSLLYHNYGYEIELIKSVTQTSDHLYCPEHIRLRIQIVDIT